MYLCLCLHINFYNKMSACNTIYIHENVCMYACVLTQHTGICYLCICLYMKVTVFYKQNNGNYYIHTCNCSFNTLRFFFYFIFSSFFMIFCSLFLATLNCSVKNATTTTTTNIAIAAIASTMSTFTITKILLLFLLNVTTKHATTHTRSHCVLYGI